MERLFAKRERVIFYIAIFVIIFSICFNLLIAPILNKNHMLNKEINAARIKLKKYLQLLSRKEYIQTKYSKFTTTLELSDQEEDTAISALSELEDLAKRANIHIIDIRPQSASKNLNLYKEIFIDLKTTGTMEGYLNFIYNLENSLSLLKIKKFQLSAKPNSQILEGSFYISQLFISE
ncbi:MAG: hypothetical protein FJZ16_04710 [Candidatus Omnitrophica bacterium]|nr:hypothetical protein [Candidatus Omnitrophota bacterium]